MIEILTSVLAGALTQVAAAATISNAASGIVGNRADALFMRSVRAVSAGFRYLSGSADPSSAAVIVQSVQTALVQSLHHFVANLSSQATNLAERMFVEDLRQAVCRLNVSGIPHLVGLSDAIRPLLASVAAGWDQIGSSVSQPLVQSVVEWCEISAGRMPERFKRLLVEEAPNSTAPWINNFRDQLADEMLRNAAFERLLVVSNLSGATESSVAVQSLARSLQSGMIDVVETLYAVDSKVDQIVLHQDEQLAHLRRLSVAMAQMGSAPSAEASSRVLASTMFGINGEVTPTALIFVSAFGAHRDIDVVDRSTRLALVREVHGRLVEAAGDTAYVGRFDGGEFDVIIRGIDSVTDVKRCCSRIAEAFLRPFRLGEGSILLTPKLGAAISPEHGFAPEALQRNADLALRASLVYGSKDIVVYRPELHANARDRKLLEDDLRRAISVNELYVVFQPIISLADRSLTGFEALVRWSHSTRGLISPASFIPIAEEMGLIPQIGDWMIEAACAQAACWPNNSRVAVNISPLHFASPQLPATIINALTASNLAPDRLELEITEGVFLNDTAFTEATFAKLKAIGVRFALDDFGTGYSSLGYLRQARLDRIKIDQSFVQGVTVAGSRNSEIIRAIVALARSLNMEVTAEGIETEDELSLVKQLGCTHGQGYLFGRPFQPAEARDHANAAHEPA